MYAYLVRNLNAPSQVKIRTLEARIEQQKEDITILELENKKLYKQLSNTK